MRSTLLIPVLALLLSLTSLLACARAGPVRITEETPDEVFMPQHVIPTGEDAERTEDGLVRVRTPDDRTVVYVKPPRPELERFDTIYVSTPQIRYRRGSRPWGAREEAELAEYFRDVFIDALHGDIWGLGDEPGAGVLFVRISLIDVHVDVEPSRGIKTTSTTFASSGGSVVLVLDFFDSETAEPLLRYVEKRRLPGGVFSGGSVERDRLKIVVGEFASDLGEYMQRTHQIIEEIQRRERLEAEG